MAPSVACRVGRRIDFHRHSFPTALPEILTHPSSPRRVMFGRRVTDLQTSDRDSWTPGSAKVSLPSRKRNGWRDDSRNCARPGMPWLDLCVGELGFFDDSTPQRLEDDLVRFLCDQPLRSTAFRAIEKRKPRELANRTRENCEPPARFGAGRGDTGTSLRKARFASSICSLRCSARVAKLNHILDIVAREVASVVPILDDLTRNERLPDSDSKASRQRAAAVCRS